MSAEPQKNQRLFIDTNILIYAYDRTSEAKHRVSVQLLEGCWKNKNGCLSLQVLQEFYVNVTQKIPKPLERNTARQIIADLAQWQVHTPDIEDVLQAIDLQQAYSLSFWDAMVIRSAVHLGCSQLISEDLSPGQSYGEIQIINPFL
jgi:predicted nucleic acid-binding protein